MATPTKNNLVIQNISQGTHLFSTNFVKIVAKEKSGNLICSPLSVNIVLSMTANGAEGETKAEYENVLKLPVSKEWTVRGYQDLIDELNSVKSVTLKLANKVFIDKHFPVKSKYQQDLQTFYRSDIQLVNFTYNNRIKAANIINTWCKEKTNDRIDNIIGADDINDLTELVLANAVYFKGKWAKKFDPKATKDRPFHIDANTVKNVPTMYRRDNYLYVDLPKYDAKCIELPYASEDSMVRQNKVPLSMMIILPNEVDGLAALTEKLEDVITECRTRLTHTYGREVRVFLPKFTIESKLDLEDILSKKMGLVRSFSDGAEYTGISDVTPLQVTKVVQKAFIEVNEEGSEATAVVAQLVGGGIPTKVEHLVFDANRPFYYQIRYYGEINDELSFVSLFEGQVKEPKI